MRKTETVELEERKKENQSNQVKNAGSFDHRHPSIAVLEYTLDVSQGEIAFCFCFLFLTSSNFFIFFLLHLTS